MFKITTVRESTPVRNTPKILCASFSSSAAIMADVVAERVAEQKAVLNGEAEDREETDPVEETGKKKKKKKKKSKTATAGEVVSASSLLIG